MENRGGYTTNGAGATYVVTNFVDVSANGGSAAQTNFFNVGETTGTIPINYDMYTIPDEMSVYYSKNATPANLITNFFTNGIGEINVSFPPAGVAATSTYLTIVMNETNRPTSTDAWTYTIGGIQTNYAYLTFTDDTNLTTIPIEYAVPPFVPSTTNSGIVWSDSFESYSNNIYTPLTPFGGWTVLTNQVAITNSPPAFDGTNFLALMDGAVATNLPTVAGQKYTLQYAQGVLPFSGFYVANAGGTVSVVGSIDQFNMSGIGNVFGGSVVSPSAVAFDTNGDLYVADYTDGLDGDGVIYEFTPDGRQSTFATGLNFPDALAFDAGGNLYVADYNDGTVIKFTPPNPNGSALPMVLDGPTALAFDTNGNLYVADGGLNGSNTDNTIQKFTPGGVQTTFTGTGTFPDSLAFDTNGNLYEANDNNEIQKFRPNGTPFPNLSGTWNNPTALAFDPGGNLYVAENASPNTIKKFTPGGVQSTFTSSVLLNNPVGLVYHNNNNPEATNDADWQLTNLTFTASQANQPLVLDASGGGFAVNDGSVLTNTYSDEALFDDFSLTAIPSDLYYLPEQPLSSLAGTSASGAWELEIQDDRVGGNGTNATLVSWELQFVFGNTNAELGSLSGGQGETNFAGADGIAWYQVIVPPTANFATNRLKFASAPVNVWFDTNNPPTTNILFLPDATYPSGMGGTNLLSTTNVTSSDPNFRQPPNITDGETYYLGVQNTNGFAVNYAVEVDFDQGNVTTPTSFKFTGAMRKTSGSLQLQWTSDPGTQVEVQWSDSLTSPMQWNTITSPNATTSNGVSTFTDDGSQTAPLGAARFYRLVQTPSGVVAHQPHQ